MGIQGCDTCKGLGLDKHAEGRSSLGLLPPAHMVSQLPGIPHLILWDTDQGKAAPGGKQCCSDYGTLGAVIMPRQQSAGVFSSTAGSLGTHM